MVCAQLSGFSGGGGTQDDPWQISTPQDLDDLRQYCLPQYDAYNFFCAIKNDIEIPANFNGGGGWTPIGWDPNSPDYFYGNLDGGNYTISGIELDNEDCTTGLGLFWGINGTVQNLTVEGKVVHPGAAIQVERKGLLAATLEGAGVFNCHVTGDFRADGNVNGGLVGYAGEGSQIDSSSSSVAWWSRTASDTVSGGLVGENWGEINESTASIAGGQHSATDTVTGGLVGINHSDGTIDSCTTEHDLSTSAGNIGGIAGVNQGEIRNTTANGNVTALSGINVGGLVGDNITVDGTATIRHSHATGNIVGGDSYLGGLVGKNTQGSIERCSASGTVRGGTNCIGGLVGASLSSGMIEYSYAYGATGNAQACRVGGLVGHLESSDIIHAYARGDVTGETDVGGLVGHLEGGSINYAYAWGDVTGETDVGGLIGLHGENAQLYQTYAVGNVTGDSNFAPFAGHSLNPLEITESYYRDENVPSADGIGGISPNPSDLYGRFGAQMRQEETFANWDFYSIWVIQENVGYPVLWWPSEDEEEDENNPNPRNALTVAPLRITGFTVATSTESGPDVTPTRDVTLTWAPDTDVVGVNDVNLSQIRYVIFESTTDLAAEGGGWEPYPSGPTPDGSYTSFTVPLAEPNRFFRAKAVLR
jgi:hypothetical protein